MNIARCVTGLLFSSFVFAGVALAEEAPEVPQTVDGTTKVTAEDVISLVEKNPKLVIIDSRKSSDFENGFIEGAISLPNTDTNAASLAKIVATKTTPILFYCNGIRCGRSGKAAGIAKADGYTKLYWFRGGMEEWEAKGLPVTKKK